MFNLGGLEVRREGMQPHTEQQQQQQQTWLRGICTRAGTCST
jgi:hypothetical protein